MSGLFVIGSERATGKSAIALAVLELLSRRVGRLAVFRPVVENRPEVDGGGQAEDPVLELLRSRGAEPNPYAASVGVTYDALHQDPEAATEEIVARYRALAAVSDGVLVVGTDFTDIGASGELVFNAHLAADMGLPVLAVVSGHNRTLDEVAGAVELVQASLAAAGADVEAIVANRVQPGDTEALKQRLGGHQPPAFVIPEEPLLHAPTVADLVEAAQAEVLAGDAASLELEVGGFVVGSMMLQNLLDRLRDGALVITGGDRSDIILGTAAAHASRTFPSLAGVLLTGGLKPPEQVLRLLKGLGVSLPVVSTKLGTYDSATLATNTVGRITPRTRRKIEVARRAFEQHVDEHELLERVVGARPPVVTPLMFQYELLDRARGELRHVVLPEGEEDRLLRSADSLLRRGVVELTLLGDPETIKARAAELRLDIRGAHVIDPSSDPLRERFAAEYAEARKHKGISLDAAHDAVADPSYFGTMMVRDGLADGMVSGAVHTTAETIRPAFELIKTKPGVSVVSSVFLMCLQDRVLVYGDCAVIPDPTADELADIAISSAQTAAQFGIEPRVALLSYSTGTSGKGADVDKVRTATELVRQKEPELVVDGPIQYDAAVDAVVARTKLPNSPVAGRATVLIFPDLNTGNNTYKAVQRSAGAVAIGPVLQGLNKPVNDLSRGALVQDIVNTVAITAIQAQG